jgi:hypothetical protein
MNPSSIEDLTLLPACFCVDNTRSISEIFIVSSVTAYPDPSKVKALFGEIVAKESLKINPEKANNIKSIVIVFILDFLSDLVYNLLLNYFRLTP